MAESKQHWLDRNRPPRVQITYDVETGGAMEKKDLPFVVGVFTELGGTIPGKTPPALKDRKIIEVDRDNFDDFMASISPGVKVGQDELHFEKLDDFHPDQIVQRVQRLKDLLTIRQNLNDLLAKIDGNDDLISQLQKQIEGLH